MKQPDQEDAAVAKACEDASAQAAQDNIFVGRIEDLVEERQDLKEAYFRAKRDEAMFRRQLHRIRDGGSAIKRLQSRVRQLEHRQYVASTRQTNLVGDYAQLREKIDHGRREVLILDEKIRDLDNDVIERKEEVARIVAASRVAFARRGEAMVMIQQLEKRHQEAATEFEREWDALSKVMTAKENRYKMEFSKLRLGMPTQAKEIEKKILKKVQRDEKKLKIAVATGNWATARTRIAPHIYNEKVHTFEDSFKKVQQLTGARDLEDLAEIMAASEDKNYRAFQHLAAMNTEASSLEASVAGLHAQLDESKHHTGAYSAFKRRVIQDLRDDCDNICAEADELELASNGLSEAFETFRPHLRDIFGQAQCDSLPLPEHFSIDELSDSEVLQCLGLIEQRVNEILHVFACVASVAREKAKALDSYQTFHSVMEEAGLGGQSSKDAARRGYTNPEATAARAALLSAPTDVVPRLSVASVVGPSKPKRDRTIRVTPPKLEDHDVQEVDPNDPFRDANEVHRPWHRDNQGSSLHLHFYSS
ncbi:Coiled-coil domain-containing protein 63 [Hondaea fermentalgiana]|uniref:Coiled-coil domain-containing protein 63 n=1 Tax=Hondaea fermentalgiana TaxID=2315210 RepID=A0A2R5G7P5_9STRA|nr:Coiled-coil domain-containing protein 63 [Hondaea fermentalgiana]|eukprot:GBG27072.1 Coiled-coil domain-containing protein 63 [Hondaea fermentalgiana]